MDLVTIYLLVFAIVMILILFVAPPYFAARKGYKWYFWIPTSMLGLLVLAVLPSANKPGLSEEEQLKIRKKGNRVGIGFTVLVVGGFLYQMAMGIAEELGLWGHGISVWQSNYHPVRVTYHKAWVLGNISNHTRELEDTSSDLSAAFLHTRKEEFYFIKMIVFDPKRVSYDEEKSLTLLKEEILNSNPANKLVKESSEQFHGATYRRLCFKRYLNDAKVICLEIYRRQMADRVVILQIGFPYDEELVAQDRLPRDLQELDSNVRFFESEQ